MHITQRGKACLSSTAHAIATVYTHHPPTTRSGIGGRAGFATPELGRAFRAQAYAAAGVGGVPEVPDRTITYLMSVGGEVVSGGGDGGGRTRKAGRGTDAQGCRVTTNRPPSCFVSPNLA